MRLGWISYQKQDVIRALINWKIVVNSSEWSREGRLRSKKQANISQCCHSSWMLPRLCGEKCFNFTNEYKNRREFNSVLSLFCDFFHRVFYSPQEKHQICKVECMLRSIVQLEKVVRKWKRANLRMEINLIYFLKSEIEVCVCSGENDMFNFTRKIQLILQYFSRNCLYLTIFFFYIFIVQRVGSMR